MTVTSNPTELEAAAARAVAFGDHAYAAALYQEAIDNQSKAPTTAVIAHKATVAASVTTALVASHVRKTHGGDGSVQSGGAVS